MIQMLPQLVERQFRNTTLEPILQNLWLPSLSLIQVTLLEKSLQGPYAVSFEGWPFTQSAEELAELAKMLMAMVSIQRLPVPVVLKRVL